jgi:hypothetical protein
MALGELERACRGETGQSYDNDYHSNDLVTRINQREPIPNESVL